MITRGAVPGGAWWAGCLVAIVVAGPGAVGAGSQATLNVSVPTFIAKPGDTVKVLLDLSASPALYDIRSVEYRLKLGASVIQRARVLNEGFVTTWGAPFVNATPDSVLLAAAGGSPVTSSNVRMSTVELIVKPTTPSGTDLPITFTRLLFNEGTPSVGFTAGVLKVRSGTTDVAPGGDRAGLSLRVTPNPAWRAVAVAFDVPVGGGRLELFAPDGRRLRSEAVGAGARTVRWTLDARGARLAPGVYFVRLRAGGAERVARVAVLE